MPLETKISPRAYWAPQTPLRSGLAIRADQELGSLGVALAIDGDTYFTASAHVIPPGGGIAPELYDGQAWIGAGALTCAPETLAAWTDLERYDLCLLKAHTEATNDLHHAPEPFAETFVRPALNARLRYLGARNDTTQICDHVGPYGTDDALHFKQHAPLEQGALLLTRLPFDVIIEDVPGTSGAAVWTIEHGRLTSVGHLVAVSAMHRGLVVEYQTAFAALGLDRARVKGAA